MQATLCSFLLHACSFFVFLVYCSTKFNVMSFLVFKIFYRFGFLFLLSIKFYKLIICFNSFCLLSDMSQSLRARGSLRLDSSETGLDETAENAENFLWTTIVRQAPTPEVELDSTFRKSNSHQMIKWSRSSRSSSVSPTLSVHRDTTKAKTVSSTLDVFVFSIEFWLLRIRYAFHLIQNWNGSTSVLMSQYHLYFWINSAFSNS